MAKAKTLVGLDVHATKIVAAVLDAETGELPMFRMNGDAGAAAAFCAGCRARRASRMRRARPGTGWRVSPRGAEWSVWSRRRARSRGRPGTGSRPTGVDAELRLGPQGGRWSASWHDAVRVSGLEEEALGDSAPAPAR